MNALVRTLRNFSSLFTRLTEWLADAQNGIERVVARVFKGDRAELEELCLGATCVNEQQLQSILSASAAAGAPASDGQIQSSGTPSGSSAPTAEASADTATTTTPAEPEPSAAISADTAPTTSSADSSPPTDAANDTPATDDTQVDLNSAPDVPAESEPDDIAEEEDVVEEPQAPEPQAANDNPQPRGAEQSSHDGNSPTELPATGTD